MNFEWDPDKNQANLEKHGIAFEDVTSIFEQEIPFLVYYDDRFIEDRWIGLGLLKTFVIIIVYTEPDDETIRIISARLANKDEQKSYFKAFGK